MNTQDTATRHYSPSVEAERHSERWQQEQHAVRDAAAALKAELSEALRTNPAHTVCTPGWKRKTSPAHEVLACELDTHSLAFAEFLRDAAAGKSVWLQAQLLMSLVCNSHADNHAEELL